MENVRIFGTNLGTTWQNQSYKHVAVIAFNPPHAWPFQNLESHVRTCGNQAVCIHLYSRQRGLHELVHVSLASQQSKQTGNFAEIVTYKLHCLHEQIAYICMTHYHVLGIAHDMFFIGNAFAECWVASCYFHATLCLFFQLWKEYGEKILQSKSVSECADQAIWLYGLNGVCLWQAQSKNIFKGMPTYSHGKEQTYHKSETRWEQILMLTPSSQWEITGFFCIFWRTWSD